MNWIQEITQVFRAPSADVLAVQELEDARRSLLTSQSAVEWAKANLTFNEERVARLRLIVMVTNK